MKARIENQKIILYRKVPGIFHGTTGTYPGGFHLQSDSIHEREGFYPVVVPEYNSEDSELGTIYFNKENKVFTYNLLPVTYDLETIRQQKHEEFSQIVEGEMTDALKIGVLEKLAMGEPVSQETKDKVTALRVREIEVKILIDSITDPVVMNNFSFDRTEIEADKKELKSARKL